jgi:hypothetical protein
VKRPPWLSEDTLPTLLPWGHDSCERLCWYFVGFLIDATVAALFSGNPSRSVLVLHLFHMHMRGYTPRSTCLNENQNNPRARPRGHGRPACRRSWSSAPVCWTSKNVSSRLRKSATASRNGSTPWRSILLSLQSNKRQVNWENPPILRPRFAQERP